jgi:hypothetical protein
MSDQGEATTTQSQEKGKRKSIFISHSSTDKYFTHQLAEHLRKSGIEYWLDESQLLVSDPLKRKIKEAIARADYLGVIISSNSINSGWVKFELSEAIKQQRVGKPVKILPIVIEKMEFPQLQETLHTELKEYIDINDIDVLRFLQQTLYVDFTEPKNYYRSIGQLLNLLGYPFEENIVIYSDELKAGWDDASWICECHYNSNEYMRDGKHTIRAEIQAYGGLAFRYKSGVNLESYSKLEIFLNGGESGGQELDVFINDRLDDGVRTKVPLEPLKPNTWELFSIPLKDLDAENIVIYKINIHNSLEKSQPMFYISDVMIVKE